jgi:hypothetical protein
MTPSSPGAAMLRSFFTQSTILNKVDSSTSKMSKSLYSSIYFQPQTMDANDDKTSKA